MNIEQGLANYDLRSERIYSVNQSKSYIKKH